MSNRSKSWSWRHAIMDSGLPPTTRHVLLTISCCMNELGEGCYRTTREFAEFTGLSERAICTHIEVACKAGWLTKNKHGFRGQKWKTHDYKAAWPDDPIASNNREKKSEGTEPRSVAFDAKALNVVPKGTEPNDIKALNEVQQDKNDSESSQDSLSARGRASGVDTPEREEFENDQMGEKNRSVGDPHPLDDPKKSEKLFFEKFKHWPRWDVSPKPPMLKAWNGLCGEDKQAAAERVDGFLLKCKQDGVRHPCAIASYLGGRMWEAIEVVPERASSFEKFAPFGAKWVARRMALLAKGRDGHWTPTRFQQGVINDGRADMWTETRHKGEYRAVAAMDAAAADGNGVMVKCEGVAVADGHVAVGVGSDEWQAWADYHQVQDWPFMAPPAHVEWVWMPARVPQEWAGYREAGEKENVA